MSMQTRLSRFAATLVLFLALSIAASLNGQTPSQRMSLQQFIKDPARLASLKHGVEVMKSRKPSDPKSWFYQASIHGVTPEAVAKALADDPGVAKVDQARFWNQCPHDGPASANFVLWHRMYLYYFERILREASGEPTLSVPYWDYETQRRFPAVFADPVMKNNAPTNPLYAEGRELSFMRGLYQLTDDAISTENAFAQNDFFGDSQKAFAGSTTELEPDFQGTLEKQPHNMIHLAIGGVIGDAAGLMADVPTAAFDPIFWVHHANIDRLWSVWDCGASRNWGAVPPSAWLDEKPWWFNDVDGSVKNISRRDYLTDASLYDRYAAIAPCSRLSAKPLTAALAAAPALLRTVTARYDLGTTSAPITLSATEPVARTIKLAIPKAHGPSLKGIIAAATPAAPRNVVVEVRGVDYPKPPNVGYYVYAQAGAGPKRRLGTLALFGIKHHHMAGTHTMKAPVQQFDVTALAAANGIDAVKVTIEPFDLLEPVKGSKAALRRRGGVTVSSMAVTVVESSIVAAP